MTLDMSLSIPNKIPSFTNKKEEKTRKNEVVGSVIKQEKQIKGIENGQKDIQLPLLADNMAIYVENLEKSTEKKGFHN